jgi:crotonobetainyl-CoA:carnitine CoA-transferase CaiB-like acyl-CoA transferase
MERLGLGYDVLKEINPKIIYAALSGFGQYGPYTSRPAYASIAEAMSGHTRLTGDGVDPEGPPIQMAQAYGDLGPGTMAAMSVIAAIRHRDRTGVGQMIDVAQLDCMLAYNTGITSYMLTGLKPHEIRKKYPRAHMVGGLRQTKDGGWVQIAGHRPKAMDKLREMLGVEELTQEVFDEIIASKNRDELVEFIAEVGLPIAPIYDIPEIEGDPHIKAREIKDRQLPGQVLGDPSGGDEAGPSLRAAQRRGSDGPARLLGGTLSGARERGRHTGGVMGLP